MIKITNYKETKDRNHNDCKGCLSEEVILQKFYYCPIPSKITIENKEYNCPCCICLVKMTCLEICKKLNQYSKLVRNDKFENKKKIKKR